ncbi:MAG: iron-sulfur cluster assembly accessory protein [Holosporaceae bacterium]|nr:MAG: iron-sulfur cluster assembly accessory protein [Holosporaceae bacterium]
MSFPLTITPRAWDQIDAMLQSRGKKSLGIRISVKTRGCTGNAYTLEFSEEKHEADEVVVRGGTHVFIDPKATLFILGSEMDYEQKEFESGFTFKNPNEKGRCGCGESFYV